MPLYRLLYRSDIALAGPPDEVDAQIDEIVANSSRSNGKAGLSGALFASNGVFIQALEGPLGALEATFERICGDLRHKNVRLIELAAAEDRIFPEWRMVRVEQDAQVLDLCAVIGMDPSKRLDISTTTALVSLMRSMLLTNTVPHADRYMADMSVFLAGPD